MRTLAVSPLLAGCLLLVACGDQDATGPAPPFPAPSLSVMPTPAMETLISYWKFDDGEGSVAADAAGVHPGTLVNGPTWTTGRAGGALHFDGVNDYVDAGLGHPDMTQLLTWTLEAWVKWEGGILPRRPTIIAKPAGSGSFGWEYGFGLHLSTWSVPDPQVAELWGWSNIDYYWPWARTAPAVSAGAWTHVAVTCSNVSYFVRDYHVYLDGQEVPIAARNVGGTILSLPRIAIGAGNMAGLSSPESYFNGILDEVAIHGSVLPPEEIRRHYENGLKGLGYDPVITVDVDIRPGSTRNPVELKSKGLLPVAVLTSNGFDASTIDPGTVILGDGADPDTPVATRRDGSLFATVEDADGDGDLDLVLHFEIPALVASGDLGAGTTFLRLSGSTLDGMAIQGADSITVVGTSAATHG